MNAKDEESTVKRGSRENRKIWTGVMGRPSLEVQAPWGLSFDTVTSPHGKKAPETTIKTVPPVTLSTAWEKSIKSACNPFKHTNAATEEKWSKIIQYREKIKWLSGVHCRWKYNNLCISVFALPKRENASSVLLLTSIFSSICVRAHGKGMGRWEKGEAVTRKYKKSSDGNCLSSCAGL